MTTHDDRRMMLHHLEAASSYAEQLGDEQAREFIDVARARIFKRDKEGSGSRSADRDRPDKRRA